MINALRLAMLISGGGTTMRAILDAHNSGRLPRVQPVLVIASRPDAGGIEKARAAGVAPADVVVIARQSFPKGSSGREQFGAAILAACRSRSVDLIGQYGWLPMTPANVIEAYPGRMVNQHPGPLDPGRPDFGGAGMYGRRVHCARLLFVRRVTRDFSTEATAQRVAPEFDRGPIIRRRVLAIRPQDDVLSLQERLLPKEHAVQIEALEDFAEDRVVEWYRAEPLVRSAEVRILTESKNFAQILFPNG